jgi:hypothetical protein
MTMTGTANEWVVTYRLSPRDSYDDDSERVTSITEFFRGSEEECRRIKDHFANGECDLVKTNPWKVIIGPARDWDDFLSDACDY